ncbi:MAG: peptidase MA domain-containing protein [Chloroflexi bacterium]|nr:peptidase MA domain-containing protein [Chloroflexota bacterium]
MRKTGFIVLLASLLVGLLGTVTVQAGGGLAVTDSSVEIDFPMRLNFSLTAESDVDITDIRLQYRVDRMGHARVISEVFIEFAPAPAVEAGWTWDMRKTGGLPPGSRVDYWWTVENAAGDRIETSPSRLRIEDSRYAWQSLTDGLLTLYWYEGDTAFAREIINTARQVLAWLAETTGARLKNPINLYIYASAEDLQGAMIFPQEWTGGVAFTRYSTIAIGIAPDRLEWGRRAMAHEITHLVTHQMVFNPYNDLPTWLEEGLAMYAEGPLYPVFADLLAAAAAEDSLISVRSLSSPFSAYAEESALAYAQSYSIIDFLISSYGQESMLELLNTFSRGSGYDEALMAVYSLDMDGLNVLWRQHIRQP